MILITSNHNQKSLSLPFSINLNGILIHLSLIVCNSASPSPESLFSSMSPALVKSATLNCTESHLSIITHHKMLSKHWSLCLSCPESNTAILYLLAVRSNLITNFRKFKSTLQGSSVKLLSLMTYFLSFTSFTGFLLNKELNTNCFSLPSNL